MSTLLKAHLLKTDNPFLMFKCYMEERESILKAIEGDKWIKDRDAARRKKGWKPPKRVKYKEAPFGRTGFAFPKGFDEEKEKIPDSIDELPNEGYAEYSKKEWEAAVKENKPPYGEENKPEKVGRDSWTVKNPNARAFWMKVMDKPEGEEVGETSSELSEFVGSILGAKVVANPRQLREVYEDLQNMREEIKSYSHVMPKKGKKDEKLELTDIFDTKLRLPPKVEDPFNARIRGENLKRFRTALMTLKEGVRKMPEKDKGLANKIEEKVDVWLKEVSRLLGVESKRIREIGEVGSRGAKVQEAREGLPDDWAKHQAPMLGAFARSKTHFKKLQDIISIRPEHISVKDVENPVGNRLKKKYIYIHPSIKSMVRKLSGKKGTKIMKELEKIHSEKNVLKDWVIWHIEEEKKPLAAAGEGLPEEEEGPSIIETRKYAKKNWEEILDKLDEVKGSKAQSKAVKDVKKIIKEIRTKLKLIVNLTDKTNEKVHGEYSIKFLTLLHHLRRQEHKIKHIPKRKVEAISQKDKKQIKSIQKEIEKLQEEFKKLDKYLKRNKLNPKDKPRSKKEENIFKRHNDILDKLAELNTKIENLKQSIPIHNILRERLKELERTLPKYDEKEDVFPEHSGKGEPSGKTSQQQIEEAKTFGEKVKDKRLRAEVDEAYQAVKEREEE